MEKDTEKALKLAAEAAGGLAVKFFDPHFTGLPDRIVLLPGECLGFVEVKQPGESPTARQAFVHKILRRLGFKVFTLTSKDQIEKIITEIQKTHDQGQ